MPESFFLLKRLNAFGHNLWFILKVGFSIEEMLKIASYLLYVAFFSKKIEAEPDFLES
ncbi:MAG: hypothetical protein N3F05_00950 [Candidatus Diapherotrites archaeon]|nr:hypothetical protein [Candidatus Diapherotrites archaeon]